jgi:hypothetical protein
MSGFDLTKLVGAVFLALLLAMLFVVVAQQGAKMAPSSQKTIVRFDGGGTMEIEGAPAKR